MSAQMEQTRVSLTNTELVSALRKQAALSPAFNSMCYVFAMRERARQQITIVSLRATLAREGFFPKTEELEKNLRFLANMNIGRLETDLQGRVAALKDVRVTLQSLGQAAISNTDAYLKTFKPITRFTPIADTTKISKPAPTRIDAEAIAKSIPKPVKHEYPVFLKTVINGAELVFPMPFSMTSEQLGAAVVSMIEKAKGN